MASKFRHAGAHPEDLADGRMVAPGEAVFLTDEEAAEPFNQAKIADGVFIPTGEKSEELTEKAERAQSRREKAAERSDS